MVEWGGGGVFLCRSDDECKGRERRDWWETIYRCIDRVKGKWERRAVGEEGGSARSEHARRRGAVEVFVAN